MLLNANRYTLNAMNTQYAIRTTQYAIRELYNGDVFHTCADISRIQSKLGYQPRIDFEEGLTRTVNWFRKTKV